MYFVFYIHKVLYIRMLDGHLCAVSVCVCVCGGGGGGGGEGSFALM